MTDSQEPLPVKKISAMDSPAPEPTDLEKFLGVSGNVKKIKEVAGKKEVLKDDAIFKKIIELESANAREGEIKFSPSKNTSDSLNRQSIILGQNEGGNFSPASLLSKLESNYDMKNKIKEYLKGTGKRTTNLLNKKGYSTDTNYGTNMFAGAHRFAWNPKEWWRIEYGG